MDKQTEHLYEDMCDIDNLSEELIVNNLKNRYSKDQIFTYIGPTLIVINPYKEMPSLINPQIQRNIRNDVLNGQISPTPHIYMIAGKAFQGLLRGQKKQAIVISGESGAGKTESTKYCMKMLTSLSSKGSNSIQRKILACNPILEAFGNSKTVRNQNSSRFGKFVRLFFEQSNSIKGASIQKYLLQKSRVVFVGPKQRNFHVFYALFAGNQYATSRPQSYNYLSKSGCYTTTHFDDAQNYESIKQSMNQIGFTPKQQQKIWLLLKAILQLGNIQFDNQNQRQKEELPCQIVNKKKLQEISNILQTSAVQLERMLLYKPISGKLTIPGPYNQEACKSNRDSLAKSIYSTIFEFIMTKIQSVLNPNSNPQASQINILDIFGFQNFQLNSLEQLCINYANQKLLDEYNQYVFKNQMEILRQDGLQNQIIGITPPTNQPIIQLIKQIFSSINDSSRAAAIPQQNLIRGIRQNNRFTNNRQMNINLIKRDTFTIKHSPGSITYIMTGFKLKNIDKANAEIQSICVNLFKMTVVNQGRRTLLQKFDLQIERLVNQLSSAANHFVRCIKPNQEKAKNLINQQYLLTQIRYLGVMQTIKIRQKTFPFRKTYEQFSSSFKMMFKTAKLLPARKATQAIMSSIDAKQSDFMLGTRRIYMNKQIEDKLNRKAFAYMKLRNEKAAKIQRAFRNWCEWKKIIQYLQILIKKIIRWRKTMLKYHQKRQNALETGFQRIYRFSEEIWKNDEDQLLKRSLVIKKSKSKDLDVDQSSFYMTGMYGASGRYGGRDRDANQILEKQNKYEDKIIGQIPQIQVMSNNSVIDFTDKKVEIIRGQYKEKLLSEPQKYQQLLRVQREKNIILQKQNILLQGEIQKKNKLLEELNLKHAIIDKQQKQLTILNTENQLLKNEIAKILDKNIQIQTQKHEKDSIINQELMIKDNEIKRMQFSIDELLNKNSQILKEYQQLLDQNTLFQQTYYQQREADIAKIDQLERKIIQKSQEIQQLQSLQQLFKQLQKYKQKLSEHEKFNFKIKVNMI